MHKHPQFFVDQPLQLGHVLLLAEAIEECACRFAFERYSAIAGLRSVVTLGDDGGENFGRL